ncbi:MAG TPA: RelA/SpoT family protein [Candidatus Nanoarchaeia archaeon]|nr:RelA/SpoT family protein [Candidatus Nanoarchaeia archaeon]
MDLKDLIEEIKKYDKGVDVELVRKAYDFAKKAHEGQMRDSGDEYITHPLEVSKILTELRADTATICAGFLHDVVEECGVEIKDITKQFNEEIAHIVEGVTKASKAAFESPEERKAEYLRKVLLATAKDVRVIFVKIADRLHNMRTLKYSDGEKQKRISRETMDIYAPIANKLGLYSIKAELEDLSMRFLYPAAYADLKQRVSEKKEVREQTVQKIITLLNDKLKEDEVPFADIAGRAKHFYSIYKKMLAENKTFEEIYDLIALRVIVQNQADCYRALASVHQLWRPIPGRLKDYISVPKSNNYQSLHTTVMTQFGSVVEVQIRTEDMHKTSKWGVAAHWRYKGNERDKQFDKRIAWLEQIIEWKRRTPDEFIESVKVDLFQDEIVVFTPKGDPIILPEQATTLDFAYAVHTDVGDRCVRAEVNKKQVSLDTELKSGDVVSIITSQKATPSRHWLGFVKTSKAKQKIRGALGLAEERDPGRKTHEEHIDITKYLVSEDKKAAIKTSKCCAPQIHDDLLAFKAKDGHITIHKKDCLQAQGLEQSKMVKVSWNLPDAEVKTLYVYVDDEYGMVEKILNVFLKAGIPVYSINMKPHKTTVAILLKIKSIEESVLNSVTTVIDQMPSVHGIRLEEQQF